MSRFSIEGLQTFERAFSLDMCRTRLKRESCRKMRVLETLIMFINEKLNYVLEFVLTCRRSPVTQWRDLVVDYGVARESKFQV